MKQKEFLDMLNIAHEVPNCYSNQYPKNLGYYDGKKYSFDCWNLIKVILSGWKPTGIKNSYIKPSELVTGDVDGKTLLNKCSNRSRDFSKLSVPGTYLYLESDPHAGIYVGETVINGNVYNVIEATKNGKFGNGVLYTYVDKDGTRRKYKGSSKVSLKWSEYGLLTRYVDYDWDQKPIDDKPKVDYSNYPILQMNVDKKTGRYLTRGEYVKILQKLLLVHGCDPLGIDGVFGPNTLAAVKKFQRSNTDIYGNQLEEDGCVGPLTWGALYK